MFVQIAKAETPDTTPGFAKNGRQVRCPDEVAFRQQLQDQGYNHVLEIRPKDITIGASSYYRVMAARFFFKGVPPTSGFVATLGTTPIPAYQVTKSYYDMRSLGPAQGFSSELSPTELEEWFEFYEVTTDEVVVKTLEEEQQ